MSQELHENIIEDGNSKPLTATNMIRSHSVSGNLHNVQPDPVAADILRKGPEQETFTKLRITPVGMPSLLS